MTWISTTHVGSLPRRATLTDLVFARERDEAIGEAVFDDVICKAVEVGVERQVANAAGLVSDGEMSEIGCATYTQDRITGFAADGPLTPPCDLEDSSGCLKRQAAGDGTDPDIVYAKPAALARRAA